MSCMRGCICTNCTRCKRELILLCRHAESTRRTKPTVLATANGSGWFDFELPVLNTPLGLRNVHRRKGPGGVKDCSMLTRRFVFGPMARCHEDI